MNVRHPFRAALLTLSFVAGTTVLAAPAATAAPSCNSTIDRPFTSGSHERVPVYRSGATVDVDCLLGSGNQGTAVAALQRSLLVCNGQSLGSSGVDGKFGQATKTAVINVQNAHGLTPDGVYGKNTRNAMRWSVDANGDNHNLRCAAYT